MIKTAHFNSKQSLAFGFAFIILIGSVILMLPISNRSGEAIPFLSALFTSASATCVTGLVVYDTWTQFTIFGQAVIIVLIQIGGLGFMTFAILFSMALGKRIGLKERSYLMEAFCAMQIGGVVRLVRRILLGTLIFEGAGAFLLSIRFIPVFGPSKGIWYGVFHSVSAFCNAGFDLMGAIEPYSSLTPFSNDVIVNLTVMSLIIVGGVGFVIWDDVARNRWRFSRYNLHTKVTLAFIGAILAVSTALMLILENEAAFSGMSSPEKLLAALFQSVTPRTAGFNTVDTASMSESGTFFTILLMIIGAGPGSTAGGIKITTFAVILLSILTNVRNRTDVNSFNRRIEPDLVKRAFVSTGFYLMLAFCGCLIILAIQELTLRDVMFETFSAIGTVGLSMGITRELAPLSQIVIIILMYSGRVGSLTVFMSVMDNKSSKQLRNPAEKMIIG